jgi:hypothetical protein
VPAFALNRNRRQGLSHRTRANTQRPMGRATSMEWSRCFLTLAGLDISFSLSVFRRLVGTASASFFLLLVLFVLFLVGFLIGPRIDFLGKRRQLVVCFLLLLEYLLKQ